jgi:hypothetical protein
MNTSQIKSYAPEARNAFIAAMTRQAARYVGITPLEQRGDLPWPSVMVKVQMNVAFVGHCRGYRPKSRDSGQWLIMSMYPKRHLPALHKLPILRPHSLHWRT